MTTLIMLTNQLRNSGPDRVMLDIARKLDKERFKVAVISLMPDNTVRPIAAEFEKLGVDIHRFDFTKLQLETQTRFIRKKLERYITENFNNPVVQAHGYHPTLLTSGMKFPNTATIHCIASEDFIDSKGRLLGTYMVRRFKYHLRRHKFPVAISQYMMEYYRTVCGSRLHLIHNGVNFQPLKCNIAETKRRLNLPVDKKIIVIPGGLISRKNNLHTIRQLSKLDNHDFLCVFLGLGSQLEVLKAETDGDTRFRFDGYKSNVSEYLSCADLFISSSLSEGLPLASLEALCMGVPSFLSEIPPHQEIACLMDMDGVKTFSLDSDMLTNQMEKFFNSSYNHKEISDTAIRHFSSQTMAHKYEALLDEILQNQ